MIPPSPLTRLSAWRWRDSWRYFFLSFGIRPSASSFARACRRFNILVAKIVNPDYVRLEGEAFLDHLQRAPDSVWYPNLWYCLAFTYSGSSSSISGPGSRGLCDYYYHLISSKANNIWVTNIIIRFISRPGRGILCWMLVVEAPAVVPLRIEIGNRWRHF